MITFWLELVAFVCAVFALLRTQPLTIIALIASVLVFFHFMQPFALQWRCEKDRLDNKISESKSVSPETVYKGDISVKNNSAPTQISFGSSGSIQIINQQRAISREVKIEKGKNNGKFIIRLIFTQTAGMWDQGADLKLQVKTTGSFEMCRIIRGLPPAQFNVRISEDKQNGFYSYATSTAPIKNEPIVMEILSNDLIDVSQIGIEPLAK